MPITTNPLTGQKTIPLQSSDIDRLLKGADHTTVAQKAYTLDPGFKRAVDHYTNPQVLQQIDEPTRARLPELLLNRYYKGSWESQPADDLTATLSQDVSAPKQPGFVERLGQSIASVPERVQRSFGSPEVQAGKTEVSQPGRGEGFFAQLADIPGDVADLVGPSLPFFGSLFGGMTGGTVTAPTGPGAFAGAVAGAGAGAAAMEGGRQMVGDLMGVNERFAADKSRSIDVGRVATEGAVGAVSEGAGQVIVKGAAKALSPFRKQFDEGLKFLYESFGVTPTASMVSKSKAVPLIESLAQKSPFGGKMAGQVDDAVFNVERAAQNLIDEIGSTSDPTIAGKKILEGSAAFKTAYLEGRNKLYNVAAKAMSNTTSDAIPFDETKAVLGALLDKKKNAEKILGGVSLTEKLQTILGNLMGKELDNTGQPIFRNGPAKFEYKVISDALDELGKFIESNSGLLATDDAAMLGKLKATMQGEFESFIEMHAPEVFKALKLADANAALGQKYLNGVAGKVINGLKEEPTKLVSALIGPKSADRIPRLYEMVGEENVPAVQGAFARQLLEQGSNPATGITGARLEGVLKNYGDSTLEAALGRERVDALRDIARMGEGLQRARKVTEGSQTAFLARIGLYSSLLFSNPVLLAQIALGDAALSKLISSPVGMKWLTAGFALPEAAKSTIKVGSQILPRAAGSLLNDE